MSVRMKFYKVNFRFLVPFQSRILKTRSKLCKPPIPSPPVPFDKDLPKFYVLKRLFFFFFFLVATAINSLIWYTVRPWYKLGIINKKQIQIVQNMKITVWSKKGYLKWGCPWDPGSELWISIWYKCLLHFWHQLLSSYLR